MLPLQAAFEMPMTAFIVSICDLHGGSSAEITVKITDGGATKTAKAVVSASLLRRSPIFKNGIPPDSSLPLEISEEDFVFLGELSDLSLATEKALSLLGYGDCTARSLSVKLMQRGFSREVSDAAAREMTARGYINEGESSVRRAAWLAEHKLLGRRKIISEMRVAGFSRETIEDALLTAERENEIDYTELCKKRLSRSYDAESLQNQDERKKAIGAAMRAGFDWSDITAAMREIIGK